MATKVVELAPGVHRVPTVRPNIVNSFVFEEPSGELTLVDTGLKRAPKRLLAAIDQLGKQPADVTRIVLTHAHADHAGGARRMREETGGAVTVHDDDAGYARSGEVPPRDRSRWLARVLALLPGGDFEAVDVDETLSDGQVLDVAGGLLVIHTPGHTPGHVSLLHQPSGVLITGDALFNWMRVTFSVPAFCTNFELSRETAYRLGDVDYEVAAFTHGPEIRHDAKTKIKEFLAGKLRG